ncbi:MAG: hypothetical protein IRF12RH_07155 [Rickettsia helvetica]
MNNTELTNNQQSANNTGNTQIKSQIRFTFDLLKRGESEIQLNDKYKDIVLILGNTGAGKTTFTQWIAGDNDKLIAKEVAAGTGEFLIEDNNRIGNSTITSKTIFPELVVGTKTNTTYYDCPGFSDTRSTSNDIATTYFIKKVIDHAESVKMIFIINHSSVQKGLDRQDFMKLIRHAIDLVKDIDKFQCSIAIVATKVNNQYIKQGKSFTLVEDSKVIGAIADFLQEVKQDLGERVKLPDIFIEEQKFYNNSIKFIDVLLAKEDDYYTKIGIFRRPDEPGPLSNITLLQEGKEHIERILYEKLNFTAKLDEDFGYTISDTSKNSIHDLVDEINQNIWSNVHNIAEKVKRYYHDLVEQMDDKMKSFVTSSSAIVDVDPSEAQTFSSKFNEGYNITSNLVVELTNLTNPEELAGKINTSISNLDINLFKDEILDVLNQGKYFNFLQIVSDKTFSTRPWAELFKNILPYFSELRDNIEKNVSDTAEKLNQQLNGTVKAIHGHYDNKMKLLEIQELPAELRKEHDVILKIEKEIEGSVTRNELLKTMQTIYDRTNSLGISIAKNNIPTIINQEKYFNFLQTISNKELINGTLTWISPFKDAVNYLNQSEQWYIFLNSLYSKFSEYEIQKDRGKYNVVNLEDWGRQKKPQGIEINKNNFEVFLNKTAEYKIAEYDNIKNITVTGLRLKELNHVLDLTLKHKINVSCIEPYLFIKGNYIVASEVLMEVGLKFLHQHWGGILPHDMTINMDNSCNLTMTQLAKKLKFLNVFALNTLFIDEDVSLGNNTLTVIAPKWHIIGTKTISLDGVEGESHYNETIQKNKHFTLHILHGRSKAEGGTERHINGKDGKPGGAGGPGGSFFGIGDQFINGRNLTITANGGIGGAGQDGGDGFKGRDGSSPIVKSASDLSPCYKDLCDGGKQINGFNCKKIDYSYHDSDGKSGLYFRPVCKYKLFGTPGTKGGDGGNGGRGGIGGLPGSIALFELSNDSRISKYNDVGKDGKNGTGGIGGDSGNDIDYIVAYIANAYSAEGWRLEEKIYSKKSPSGRNGTDGGNSKDIKNPKSTDIILEPAKIINQYKSYLRENLNDRFTKSFLTKFSNSLDSNQNVKDVYNTLGLVDELQGLEEQFYKLNKDIDLLPFYQSLLERISEYAKHPKDVGDSNEYKKVLSYLYTATLSKIYSLQDNSESNLIINITSYLNLVKENISELKDLQHAQNKKNIINKYKQDYKEAIDKKIAEARELISQDIRPEIENISTEIDTQIKSLIDDVTTLQNQNKKETKEFIEHRNKLENALVLQSLLAPIKIIGQMISFVPGGAVVGTAIGVGSKIAESFVLDNQNSQYNTSKLPQGISNIESLIGQMKTIRDQKVIRLKKTLEDISQGINEHSEKLGNISVKVAEIKDRLNKIDEKRFNFKEIRVLENELTATLQTQEGELQKSQVVSIADQNTVKALSVLQNFKKAMQFSEVLLDTYSKYKTGQTQLDVINEAINRKYKELQRLKQYEDTIYDVITPTLQNMQDDLSEVANKLGNKSSVALDVTKWQVQSTIRDMQLQMQQMTQGLKTQANLVRCIEKLEDAMTILINVYDHIQNYQKEQNLTNYIANISSAGSSNIDITDENLKDAVASLEILIRSNLVLKQYQTAINGFKQFVFPFAHIYLKELVLPSHLELGGANKNTTTLENLVYSAIEQIKTIRSELIKDKTISPKHYEFTATGEFKSGYISNKPFFVWKNEQHKNMFSKLLSGQEVVVRADIMDSSSDKDAIKFNNIALYFKATNQTVQSEIDNVLKGFQISATHLGNSYYRYNDTIYLITTTSQKVSYYFEKKHNKEEPVVIGDTYGEIKNGNFMLSPYALWKISLYNLQNKYNLTFNNLEIYKDKIDLELIGNGRFINKINTKGLDLKLNVERYYKAIDTYYHLDLHANNEDIALLKDSTFTRNKLEANQELEDKNLQTIVDQKQVTQNSQAKTEHENNNTEYSGWFSWIRLPSFNILPGAEATVVGNENSVHQQEYGNSNNMTMSFINGIKLLQELVLSMAPKLTNSTANNTTNLTETISNNYTDYIIRENASNSSNNLAINFDDSKNSITTNTVDINGNLLLGQLLIYQLFGMNQSLSNIHYVSLEQEQVIRINKLASEILPMMDNNPFASYTIDNFITNYNSEPQWYKDVMKDRYEEIVSKRHQRSEKTSIYANYSSEEILADSVEMFGEAMNYRQNDLNELQ